MMDSDDRNRSAAPDAPIAAPTPPAFDTDRGSIPVPDARSFESIEYHPPTGTYRATFDPTLEAPSAVVVNSVAAVAACEPDSMDRLYETIDPDILDRLFAPLWEDSSEGDGMVSFSYHGYAVTIHGTGLVEIGSDP